MIQNIHTKLATPGPGYIATSSTSLTIASSGSIALTTQAGLAYSPGARIRLTDAADVTKWMEGVVTAYAGTSLTFTADRANSSGTFSSWNLNVAGIPGSATTVAVGTTTTGAAGSSASVSNSGTTLAAVLDFTVPQGAQGIPGTAVNPRGAYAGGTTYAQFDGVTDAGIAYISLQGGNTGHPPASSPTWWQAVGSSGVTDPGANGVMKRTASNTTAPALADDISAPIYASASGTNTLTATLSPAITGYVDGTRYRVKAASANTGAVTLNLNSLGAKTVRKWSGGALVDLVAGDIASGQMLDITYDSANSIMQMVGTGGSQTPWAADEDAAGFSLTHVGKVGAGGVTAPNTSIDTDGAICVRQGIDLTLSAGANNDVNIGVSSFRRSTASGAYNITGITGGFSGRLFFLWNASAQTLTIKHYNAGSSAANRFFNPSGADVVLRANANSFAGFIYDTGLNAWVLMFTN